MYSHRVVGGLLRAALRGWAAEAARVRAARRSAGASFAYAALLWRRRELIVGAFGALARAAARTKVLALSRQCVAACLMSLRWSNGTRLEHYCYKAMLASR